MTTALVITGKATVAWIIPKDRDSRFARDELVYEEPDKWQYTEEHPDDPSEYVPKKIRKVVIFECDEEQL